jgi:hypothetical protein
MNGCLNQGNNLKDPDTLMRTLADAWRCLVTLRAERDVLKPEPQEMWPGRRLVQCMVTALCLSVPPVDSTAGQSGDAVETVVFIRHGEKPEGGFGQLNCQGLNRALALPSIIAQSFGRPDAIFAPNPSHRKVDAGGLYDYVRPLATIEPTAIWFGLPVDISLDVYDREGLQAALEKRRALDRNVFILVVWEHKQIAPIVRALLTAHGADAAMVKEVKDWEGTDFDSMYVVTTGQRGDATTTTFDHKYEGLNGQPYVCPH